jgi:hypothetical protein
MLVDEDNRVIVDVEAKGLAGSWVMDLPPDAPTRRRRPQAE